MGRQFNIAGPNVTEWHYTLPALARVPDVQRLIDARAWFILHAPRQSGKTTAMRALAHELTWTGRWAAVHASCEAASVYSSDPERAIATVIDDIRMNAELQLPAECRPDAPTATLEPGRRLAGWLSQWCRACPPPVVLLLDEIDSLQDDALIGVLRQLRSLHALRPGAAPSSVALVGLRDVRDYKVAAGGEAHLGTASPFNVATESLTLGNFTRDDVASLYSQHTQETGTQFTNDAVDLAWGLTGGQPWLVNALAYQAVHKMAVTGEIGADVIGAAKEQLILSRSTHLDSLADKLSEPRVRAVVSPMLTGGTITSARPGDVEYCIDLGILRRDTLGLEIANPIYREILPRELATAVSDVMPMTDRVAARTTWRRTDGRLDLDGLLDAFVDFWRQHGEWMLRHQAWPEAAHQLVVMAFLQRLVNGGGTIEREYGLGRGRLDLLIRFPIVKAGGASTREEDRHALELKVWRDGVKDPEQQGLAQLDGYLARLALDVGTLMIFDARLDSLSGESWSGRGTCHRAATASGRSVTVWRL